MRLGWSIRVLGPIRLSGTLWRSKPRSKRRTVYHGQLPGWQCPHNHTREDTARECARREAKRRAR